MKRNTDYDKEWVKFAIALKAVPHQWFADVLSDALKHHFENADYGLKTDGDDASLREFCDIAGIDCDLLFKTPLKRLSSRKQEPISKLRKAQSRQIIFGGRAISRGIQQPHIY